jgi:hypothetical protein
MSSLTEILNSETKKNQVVDDCCTVIDQEVADKGGLSGIAIKAGFAAVKGVKPGFVRHVVFDLLPEFAAALDLWASPEVRENHRDDDDRRNHRLDRVDVPRRNPCTPKPIAYFVAHREPPF